MMNTEDANHFASNAERSQPGAMSPLHGDDPPQLPEKFKKTIHKLVFVREDFQGCRPATLLCDYIRPRELLSEPAATEARFDSAVVEEMLRYCDKTNCSILSVLFSSFQIALYRTTAIEDVAVGLVVPEADKSKFLPLAGSEGAPLICVRTSFQNDTFREAVDQMQNALQDKSDSPVIEFEKLVSNLYERAAPNRHPLVQTIFAYYELTDSMSAIPDTHQSLFRKSTTYAPADSQFQIFFNNDSLRIDAQYSPDLFTADTVAAFLSVFIETVKFGLQNPDEKISCLRLLNDWGSSELERLQLTDIQSTAFPRESSIVDVFQQQAALYPDKVAVRDGWESDKYLTYSELDQRSDTISRWLAARQIKKETVVAVYAGRSIELLVAFLGIMKCDAAYFPMDLKVPPGRIRHLLSHLPETKLVLLGSRAQLCKDGMEHMEFIQISEILAGHRITEVDDRLITHHKPRADSLAYVMFTSGSTGQPKGVMTEHRNILQLARSNNLLDKITGRPCMAHMSNPAFDVSSWEIYVPLLNGGTIICVDNDTLENYRALPAVFEKHSIDTFMTTPAALRRFYTHCPSIFSRLKTLLSIGDRLNAEDVVEAQKHMTGTIINTYGPSEDTCLSTYYCVQPGDKFAEGVPIGRALSNSGTYVMDPQQQLVPPGVIGELVMIGAGIGRGYSDSNLDEGRFVVLQVEGKTHRAYRTGDYVRYRPRDGELEFFGRIDNQCKVKGVRTELGEIEFTMRTHALVNDAAVILHPKYDPGSRLVPFITTRVPRANLVPSNALRDTNNGGIEYSESSLLTEECLKEDTQGRLVATWGRRTLRHSAAEWAQKDLWVSKQKDTEAKSSSPASNFIPNDPMIDFGKFIDSESVVQEDLVVWFNLGNHHVPHSGDTSASSVWFMPYNFHDRDPSSAVNHVSHGPCRYSLSRTPQSQTGLAGALPQPHPSIEARQQSDMEVLPAVIAWAATSACRLSLVAESSLGQRFCPSATIQVRELARQLSPMAQILLPSDKGFEDASRRWNVIDEPKPGVVVIPGVASDVAETVKYANEHNTPFLAVGGQHGATSTLGKLQGGIEIVMSSLNSVEVSKDGQTAKVAGGALSKTVIDALWAAGKQTVTGTCECTSLLGPGLGGGHGWLQGHHGLIADQFLSMDVVLADGSEHTVDSDSDPDLWWALRGAGHNFAIVTSVTLKVFDIQHRDWARETMIFTGDKVEEVYQTMHDNIFKDGQQDLDVVVWSYMLSIPDIDAEKPVVIVYLLQEGVKVVDAKHSAALKNLGPVSVENTPGTYLDLAAWTMISMDDIPCQKLGVNNLRFPLYLDAYNVSAVRKVYDMFAEGLRGTPEFAHSIFLFENYPVQGLRKPDGKDSAFAFRDDGILVAPLINFAPGSRDLDGKAVILGEALRATLHEASGRDTMHTYVNYAFRDNSEEMYGAEAWRQEKLARLKAKYDPHGRFNFYNPVA
ncbi:hypothetical protein NLG97_g6013 [Lecanicillium saksenae]|uniref:Uncharacterized protein n=1 Tax=Lecanicillium saksenae TaxID=468837 RepID=A0ACC1QS76_9HYPO|nr:hypothetical protein NLG97_g6013 [Lecanicillium saksenae]